MVEALLLRKPANHHLLYRLESNLINLGGWLLMGNYQGQLYWGDALLIGHGQLQTSPQVAQHCIIFSLISGWLSLQLSKDHLFGQFQA